MLNNRFTCEGRVKEIRYFRGNPEGTAYVGIWRQISNDEFILKHEIALPPDVVGIHTIVVQPAPIAIDRGDFLGVHYNRAALQGVIAYSKPDDGVLRSQEFFQTQTVELYHEDVQENQQIRLSQFRSQLERKTYALQAIMEKNNDTQGERILMNIHEAIIESATVYHLLLLSIVRLF